MKHTEPRSATDEPGAREDRALSGGDIAGQVREMLHAAGHQFTAETGSGTQHHTTSSMHRQSGRGKQLLKYRFLIPTRFSLDSLSTIFSVHNGGHTIDHASYSRYMKSV